MVESQGWGIRPSRYCYEAESRDLSILGCLVTATSTPSCDAKSVPHCKELVFLHKSESVSNPGLWVKGRGAAIARRVVTVAAFSLSILQARAQAPAVPQANPARPTVSTPATLTPVGYLQFENGGFYANASQEFKSQFSTNQVTKLTITPRLQVMGLFEPFAYTHGVVGDAEAGIQPGGISVGVQGVVLPGEGRKPTVSLSYIRSLYGGSAPDIDVGSYQQGVTFLWSEDFGGLHIDTNGIFNEQTQGDVRRGQFGQTLSVSHPLGPFVLAGELWHFTQPFSNGNAVGNLWALSYAARRNLVIDAGFNHGLTSSSTQWEGFAGFTYLLPHRLWKARK
jgi:hypothetical protein